MMLETQVPLLADGKIHFHIAKNCLMCKLETDLGKPVGLWHPRLDIWNPVIKLITGLSVEISDIKDRDRLIVREYTLTLVHHDADGNLLWRLELGSYHDSLACLRETLITAYGRKED